MAFGVLCWTNVRRATTATVSAAPASARQANPRPPLGATPSNTMDKPHVAEPASISTPGRTDRVNVPENTDATKPPTAIALRNSPSVRGFPPKRSSLISGNRLMGNDNTVAARSVSNAPRTDECDTRNRRPSPTPRNPGRDGAPSGRVDGKPNAP